MAENCDYHLVEIGEFDALSIEVTLGDQKSHIPSQPDTLGKYPAKQHAHKVRDQLGVKSAFIYVPGKATTQWDDTDADAPFRQSRYAFYLCGADFPGLVVTYHLDKDDLILWIPIREPSAVLWKGTLPSPEECAAKMDVDSVRDIQDLQTYLEETLGPKKNPPTVYIPHRYLRPPRLSWERPAHGIKLETNHEDLLIAMDLARAVKTPYEIGQIRRAVAITSEAHRSVQQRIASLKNEAEVENMFVAKCRDLGAKNQAYAVIAGSGSNAASLHYNSNNEDFGDRQLMVLDAGCELECYASDVTRTFPLNGHFTNEAKKIYQIVAEMQTQCIGMIRPGASWAGISQRAREVACKGLLNIGILQRGRLGDLPLPRVVSSFFPHGLGHLVGLDTHDVISRVNIRRVNNGAVATISSLSIFGGKWVDISGGGDETPFSPPLMKDMVITCEPGIYFNKAYIDAKNSELDLWQYVNKTVLERYYPVGGVRIEDTILVTEDGYENLTTAPKGDEMIKIINGES